MAVAMQEADRRVEPDALGRAAAIMGQERIEEGKQRVDGIERWTARAAEIVLRRLALRATQRFDAFVRMRDEPEMKPSRSTGATILAQNYTVISIT
jgi:hypothetical protein